MTQDNETNSAESNTDSDQARFEELSERLKQFKSGELIIFSSSRGVGKSIITQMQAEKAGIPNPNEHFIVMDEIAEWERLEAESKRRSTIMEIAIDQATSRECQVNIKNQKYDRYNWFRQFEKRKRR